MATGIHNLFAYQSAATSEVGLRELFKSFPKDEHRYGGIVDQLRRSSASVSNNIAEAYYRRSKKEKLRILNDFALCEAQETLHNLKRCRTMQLVSIEDIQPHIEAYEETVRLLVGYIKFVKGSSEN